MVLSLETGGWEWEGSALEGEDEEDDGSEIPELVAGGDDGVSVWRLA